jgi:hypothetical protein
MNGLSSGPRDRSGRSKIALVARARCAYPNAPSRSLAPLSLPSSSIHAQGLTHSAAYTALLNTVQGQRSIACAFQLTNSPE